MENYYKMTAPLMWDWDAISRGPGFDWRSLDGQFVRLQNGRGLGRITNNRRQLEVWEFRSSNFIPLYNVVKTQSELVPVSQDYIDILSAPHNYNDFKEFYRLFPTESDEFLTGKFLKSIVVGDMEDEDVDMMLYLINLGDPVHDAWQHILFEYMRTDPDAYIMRSLLQLSAAVLANRTTGGILARIQRSLVVLKAIKFNKLILACIEADADPYITVNNVPFALFERSFQLHNNDLLEKLLYYPEIRHWPIIPKYLPEDMKQVLKQEALEEAFILLQQPGFDYLTVCNIIDEAIYKGASTYEHTCDEIRSMAMKGYAIRLKK